MPGLTLSPEPTTLTYLPAFVYGLIQGFTEFLPISSSGHLALAQHLGLSSANMEEGPPLFDILLHLSTVLAVIHGLKSRLIDLFRHNHTLLFKICLASLPAAFVGLCFEAEIGAFRHSPILICLGLLCTAVFLWLCESVPTYPHGLEHLAPRNALIIGLAQAFALIPGVSRSGLTITGGVICGLNRESSVTFSVLLMLPAVLGAALLKLVKHGDQWGALPAGPVALGCGAAFFSGVLGLTVLERLVQTRKLKGFALYCALIGGGGIIYFGCFHPS